MTNKLKPIANKLSYIKEKLINGNRIGYFQRHLSIITKHLTLIKVINLLLNEAEMQLRITSPHSLPAYIKIEPTPLCQLRCKGCAQRNISFKHDLLKLNNGKMFLSLEDLKKIVDPIKSTLIGVSLSLYGEPMLNTKIASLIEYLHNINVAVSFPTNLSIRFNYNQIIELVKSGLDCIEVALDGITQESYAKYRVGGNIDLILENVKLISQAKKELHSKSPQVIWKYVVFNHNKHEVEMVRNLFSTWGFDRYEFAYDNYSDTEIKIESDIKKNLVNKRKPCFWLWNTTIIRWDGSVRPCCTNEKSFIVGNAIENDIKEIWRSNVYSKLRKGFVKNEYGQYMHPICKKCMGLYELPKIV